MRIALLAIAALVVVFEAAAAADAWQTFRDPEGIFSFDAPGPVHALNASGPTSSGAPVHVTMYEYGRDVDGQLGCGVAKATFGNGQHVAPTAANGAAAKWRSLLTAGGVKADFDAQVRQNGFKGWRFEYRDGKKNRVWFRWFVVKNQLLQFVCTIPPTATPSQIAAANRIATSFSILAR